MSQDSKQTTIADVLLRVRDAGALDDNNGAEDWTHSDKAIDEALHLVEQLVAERVIGKNQENNYGGLGYTNEKAHRNSLRDEQRLALHDVVYGKGEKK